MTADTPSSASHAVTQQCRSCRHIQTVPLSSCPATCGHCGGGDLHRIAPGAPADTTTGAPCEACGDEGTVPAGPDGGSRQVCPVCGGGSRHA